MDGTDLEIRAKCEEAERLKEEGNGWFKQKQYTKALRSYHQSNLYVSGLIDKNSPMAAYTKNIVNDEMEKRINEIRFSLFMNMSQIYIFKGSFEKGHEILLKACQIKTTTKLKYRQAICHMNLGNLDEAKRLFTDVMSQDVTLKDEIQKYFKTIKELEKTQDDKSKKMYAKFFS